MFLEYVLLVSSTLVDTNPQQHQRSLILLSRSSFGRTKLIMEQAPTIYGIGVVAAGTIVLLIRNFFYKSGNDTTPTGGGKRLERKMSFQSSAMIKGIFPPEAEAWKTIINMVVYFERCPSIAECVDKTPGILHYDRFRSAYRVNEHGEGVFVDIMDTLDPSKDLVETVSVSSDEDLDAKVDELCSKDMDIYNDKPLWKIYRMENAKQSGRSAIVVRIHHCLGDGISLVALLGRLFHDKQGDPVKLKVFGASNKTNEGRSVGNRNNNSSHSGGVAAQGFISLLLKTLTSIFKVLALPMSAYDSSSLPFVAANRTALSMRGVKRSTVYMPTLKLEFVKDLKNKAGVTVNDVLMALITGALRRYCVSYGGHNFNAEKQHQCRFLMPVAFPRPAKEAESPSTAMRNMFAMVSVPVPLGVADGQDRLERCAATTNELKSSPVAYIQMFMQDKVLAYAPRFLQTKTAMDIFSRHSMVFSNVPGPEESIYFCGNKVTGLQVIFPNILPQSLVMSYAGGVYFNMCVDPDVVTNRADLPVFFLDECEELAKKLGVETIDRSNMVLQS